MTSLFPLRKPTYPQSFMLIYGSLFELWVLNLKKKKKKKKKKMKNSAHHSPIHLWWGGPWQSIYTKHYCALWFHLLEWCCRFIRPTPRGRVAPEGGGRINRNTTTKGGIKCLFPLIGCFLARARGSFTCMLPNKVMCVNLRTQARCRRSQTGFWAWYGMAEALGLGLEVED